LQSNLSYILLCSCLFFLQIGKAQEIKPLSGGEIAIIKKDTILPPKKKQLLTIKNDSILNKSKDTISLDSIKPKEIIEGVITHTATDYSLNNSKNKTLTLYNEAHIIYTDIDLKAGIIIIDYKKNVLFAKGIKDSLGYKQRPIFKQGGQETEQDSLFYNFKTRRAIIYGLKTKQGEIITYGTKTKRENDSTIYIRKMRFTTSEKENNPDYYIAANKAKLVPGKKIIVGLSNLVIADVPLPIAIPFAYFPITENSTSGILIPSYGETANQGFNLQNGGYYFAISDYIDLALTGDVYTNGSWGLRADSNYKLRYKYSGNFSIRFENIINSVKGFDDFSKATNFNLRWSHSQDTKSNPNARFGASVNMGSSKYYRESLNENNNSQFLTNTLSSSISYYKKFVGTPFNMNVTMTHTQNTNTQDINMTFPSLTLNMDKIYPFAGKGGIKKTPIQKLGFNYTMAGEYRIKTKDSLFFKPEMFATAKSGVRHSTGTGTNIKVFKYFTLNPTVNYKEVWNFDYVTKKYDSNLVTTKDTLGGITTETQRGFKSFREFNTGVSLSTSIYGNFKFTKGRLKAIRHTIRPSISFNYKPDFADKYNQQVQQSDDLNDMLTYSPFEEGIYGRPSAGLSNSIGITLNNVLEAKVAPKDPESDEEDKKITILNYLNFSTSYNIAADSLRWSPVRISAGTRLFKDKLSLNLGATLNLYQVNNSGQKINKFNPGIFRVGNANLTANYAFSSKDFEKETKDNNSNNNSVETPDVIGAKINPTNQFAQQGSQQQGNDTSSKTKKAKLYGATIPWTMNLAYSVNYSNNGFQPSEIGVHTLMFSGNLELTPKWKIGYSSGYDIKDGAFTFSRLNFSRDLDSWQFNFNWIPFGRIKSYSFFIGVKSSVFRDLKWDKNKPPDRRLF